MRGWVRMPERELSSREKIIVAAAEMLGEDAGANLSVRAVAARAGVSTGSLRHHFPTQRDLQDAVFTTIYDVVLSDDELIRDRSKPARERLVECLRQVLALAGVGAEARAAWGKVYASFIAPEPTDELRASYLAIEREALRRTEYWLAALVEEGALPKGDNTLRARFLCTVLNGLTVERALPAEESLLRSETQTLDAAVDWVFRSSESTQA
ncbi:TetR/AcrR family transcriptional regulator [Nocardia asteroides]|uniref:TetR/AcrR family transcriptional regulator n=1 Tax=Nocardia asteroides TaxID=1824 RepID=UPI001E5124AA|nr:TetR/AcrR family transcriptional regulator [Nocardia asteroides]UGT58630.1 TetR/AcrR family transcriptional regulator [Nocardia asteroides]